MKKMIDTHIASWTILNDPKLPKKVKAVKQALKLLISEGIISQTDTAQMAG